MREKTMKPLTKYTDKNIYGFFKPEEICFVVKHYYQDLAQADVTDDLEDAKDLAKDTDKNIYIYKREYLRNCFDADDLFRDLIDNLDLQGVNTDEFIRCSITDKQIKEFKSLNQKWFDDVVKDTWIANDIMGELQIEDKTHDLSQATFDPKDILTCVTFQDAEQYIGKEGYFSNGFMTNLRWWSKGVLKEVRQYSNTSETFLMADEHGSAFVEFSLFLPADKVNLGE